MTHFANLKHTSKFTYHLKNKSSELINQNPKYIKLELSTCNFYNPEKGLAADEIKKC
jgi:hypothetical protein